jgi:hypothetical protein
MTEPKRYKLLYGIDGGIVGAVIDEDGEWVTYEDWQRTEAARVAAEDMAAQAANGAAALIDVVNELRAKLAEAQRDAERYRWLRSDDISWQPDQREICVIMVRSPFAEDQDETLVESELDAAVDAAMATSPAAPQWPHPDGFGGGLMEGKEVALNTRHPDCHKAAHAFWQYWMENGVPHKHGYYESTWGAINQALRYVGVVPHRYSKPRIEVTASPYLSDCIEATPGYCHACQDSRIMPKASVMPEPPDVPCQVCMGKGK